jgi:hypothetical protein
MKLLPLLSLCCLYLPAISQTDSLHQRFLNDKCIQNHLILSTSHAPSKEKIPAVFSHFEVVDLRPDTTRVGFCGMDKQRYELVFDKGTSGQIATFMNHYTNPAGNRSFLIIIKKLWLYNIKDAPRMENKPKGIGCMEFRGEAFLKTDEGYLPYAYLDTVITSPYHIKDMARTKMANMLVDFINKIATTDEALAQKRKAFTFNQLDSLNNLRFDFPMDTARVLRKGVYASIDEFRNNQPSISNYDVQTDGTGFQLYLKDETGKSYYSRKMWGFCNGELCYAMLDGNLCPIFSVGHSFYVLGSTDKEVKAKNNSLGRVLLYRYSNGIFYMPSTGPYNMHFYTIDPFSGKIY